MRLLLASWYYCVARVELEVYSARPRAGIPHLFDGKFDDRVLYWQLARDRRERAARIKANLASPSPKGTKNQAPRQ